MTTDTHDHVSSLEPRDARCATQGDSRIRRPLLSAVVCAAGVSLWQVMLAASAAVDGRDPTFGETARLTALSAAAITAVFAILRRRRSGAGIASHAVAASVATATLTPLLLGTGRATWSTIELAGWAIGGNEVGGPKTFSFDMMRVVATQALVVLPVALVACFVTSRLRIRVPRVIASSTSRVPARRTMGIIAALGVAMSAFAVAPPTATAEGVGVCPAGTIVTRRYDVNVIRVDIPLNRYGDHDPSGIMYAPQSAIPAIRAQEASAIVTPGLGEDPIQPLVIRANLGECVEVVLRNQAADGNSYGLSVDGLPADSSGDDVGTNANDETPPGGTRLYRFYVPNEANLEGSHYLHPGPNHRAQINHGLFGVLSVEPAGSLWLSQIDNRPVQSGWQANIVPGDGSKAFREYIKILHEVGNEDELIFDKNDLPLPIVDPTTSAYRPGSRAMNYRAEPFMNRLLDHPQSKSHAYSSAVFGDPATLIPKSYVGDPTKIRVVHGGSEVFHVYHLHGGGDRWRLNPESDTEQDYQDTGLRKTPIEESQSDRVDAVNTGPGEHFNAEIEGGAGGTQQGAGDFLFHCHIAEHYPSGMWGLWRVYDTLQPDVSVLPDRVAPATAVTTDKLIGKVVPGGVTLTKSNLAKWVEPQLPPPGVPVNPQDATVWNWTKIDAGGGKMRYLGVPEQTTNIPPDFEQNISGHWGSFKVDQFVGNRPVLLFNPVNGRPAFPLLRPHSEQRPPFSPNMHSGAPYLGETADASGTGPKPWANRVDGLCPRTSPVKTFNVVAVPTTVPVTTTASDPLGMVFALAPDKAGVKNGTKPAQPLAIRANVGDCVALTLTSELTEAHAADGFSKVEMHIHHVQFDPQGSDGTSAGLQFEHSIRPYALEDTRIVAATAVGAPSVQVLSLKSKYRPGVAIAVGLGKDSIEYRTIVSVDPLTNTLVLDRALNRAHAVNEPIGTEFIRYRWYADALLDNIFWHDHVDGIHGWGHGGVGMFIVEPRGSTYTDPTTGLPIKSGPIADIHYNPVALPSGGQSPPLAPGLVDGDFREVVLWTLDDNPVTDSTINLRAEPFADRGLDPSTRFSSYTWGDPRTPLPRAYPGDSVVIRTIHVGPTIDSFRVDGHKFFVEKRLRNGSTIFSRVTDTMHAGVSERNTLILDGGAGGPGHIPGDYLYHNGIARRFRQGAWGIFRVLGAQSPSLQPLNGNSPPGGSYVAPTPTGGRPPALTDAGNPCPGGSFGNRKVFDVSAVDAALNNGGDRPIDYAYVPTSQVASAELNGVFDPYVLHVNVGDCVQINFRNDSVLPRVGFHVGELAKAPGSAGINVGWTEEQTVAPNETRAYVFYADRVSIEAALISDPVVEAPGDGPLDPIEAAKLGLYGAIVVHEPGATFSHPVSGVPTELGPTVDVHLGDDSYRDATLILADDDDRIGSDFMPYPIDVRNTPMINYRNAGQPTLSFAGTPGTPVVRAYAGDPVKIHVVVAPGSEQPHVFNINGMSWLRDPYTNYEYGAGQVAQSQEVQSQGVSAYQGIDVHLIGGAGGRQHMVRDYWYGDRRLPFTEGGMWGVLRVLSDATCPIRPLDTRDCVGTPGPH